MLMKIPNFGNTFFRIVMFILKTKMQMQLVTCKIYGITLFNTIIEYVKNIPLPNDEQYAFLI